MASTIRDVAKLAEVSISTVSRVSNNAPNVSKHIRQKVLRAIKILNYTPSIVAKSLETRSMKNIGVIMGRTMDQAFSNPDFFVILQGITSILSKHDYNPLLTTDLNQSNEVAHCINLIKSGAVRGLIVVGSFVQDPLLARLVDENYPFVLIGFPSDLPDIYSSPYNTVCASDKESTYNSVNYLLSRRHKRIGLIHAPLKFATNKQRYDGYIEAITNAGYRIDHTLIVSSGYCVSETMIAAQSILTLPNPPTAIFCTDDYKATCTLRTAKNLGLSVPDDISIMGHNDYQISQMTVPQLTTVSVPMFELGQTAADILLKAISNPSETVKNIFFPTKILERETVK